MTATLVAGLVAAGAAAAATLSLPSQPLTLQGRGIGFYGLAYAPDGRVLASAGDFNVRLWDAKSGSLLETLSGHTSSVNAVAFSPDGKLLVSVSEDRTVKMWDPASKRLLRTLSGHTRTVLCVAFAPDGRSFATGSGDNTIKIWDAMAGRLLHTLRGHSDSVDALTFSPDSRMLASASFDKTVKLWNAASGQVSRTLSRPRNGGFAIAISPDGRMLAVDDELSSGVNLWEVESGRLLRTLSAGGVRALAFSPDGRVLAGGSSDIKLWDPHSEQPARTLESRSGAIKALAFAPDGSTLAAASDATTKLLDISKEMAALNVKDLQTRPPKLDLPPLKLDFAASPPAGARPAPSLPSSVAPAPAAPSVSQAAVAPSITQAPPPVAALLPADKRPANPFPAGRRVALVIGNGAYPGQARLDNPVNDADDVTAALQGVGFDVIEGKNLLLADFSQKIAAFRQKAKGADAALIYYAGHGMQFDEQNWLMPVDTKVTSAFDARHSNVSLQDLISEVENLADTTLVFLDACRNNPLSDELHAKLKAEGRGYGDARGFARVDVKSPQVFMVFATRPNTVAADGRGRNSPFSAAFLQHLATPGVEIEVLMKRVSSMVEERTNHEQQPERLSRLKREFYFVPAK